MYDQNSPQSLEKYSSAVTLSDMEVFIFPELLFSLVLANAMSPRLWEWKKDSWFEKLESQNEYRRIQRLKQYIMDHFSFNLDLDTWGLTTKERELSRFAPFINESTLAQSNALFGYEGDKYYFDIDIRRHFGLDKYTSDIIPYWKTETLEAMEAFRFKPGYPAGAGECVSLATLYASALFAVAGVSLNDIFLLATPLHSQNFIDVKDGIITNNRRIVTKNMWFNGTEISGKARRAIMHERVTVVAHASGYIHTVYPEATISPSAYERFSKKLREYLRIDVSFEILAGFLRENSKLQKCFQIQHQCSGKSRFIEAEKVFGYEHSSKSRVGDATQEALLHEIDEDDYYPQPLPNRLILNELEAYFKQNKVLIDNDYNFENLKQKLSHTCFNVDDVIADLISFCRINPRLPDPADRSFVTSQPISLDGAKSAEEVIAKLDLLRGKHEVVDLAFMAYRDLSRSPWKPFLKAAFERNPVAIAAAQNSEISQIATILAGMTDESIYHEPTRIAQPDEVWNYQRGDGLEKAIALCNVIRNKTPHDRFSIERDEKNVVVKWDGGKREHVFASNKTVDLPKDDDFKL